MFRVPSNGEVPTFDDTFRVGFWKWMFSSGADRQEWTTRRNIAATLARENQNAAVNRSVAAGQERFGENFARMQARAGQLRVELRAARRARRRRY